MGANTGQQLISQNASSQQQVSATVTAQYVTPGTTQTWKRAFAAGTGGVSNYATVTTGKTAYVYGFYVWGSANDTTIALYQNDGSTVNVAGALLANTTLCVQPMVPIAIYQSGENIKAFAAATSRITILYWEQ